MPYIDYDENGKIIGQYENQQYENQFYIDTFIVEDDIEKYKVIDNQIVDVSEYDEYINKNIEQEKLMQKQNLLTQINEFDLKSIRAIREGGLKNEITGQTWIEYYIDEISELRNQFNNL